MINRNRLRSVTQVPTEEGKNIKRAILTRSHTTKMVEKKGTVLRDVRYKKMQLEILEIKNTVFYMKSCTGWNSQYKKVMNPKTLE